MNVVGYSGLHRVCENTESPDIFKGYIQRHLAWLKDLRKVRGKSECINFGKKNWLNRY